MSLNREKIEHLERWLGRKSHSRKWMKNQRNRWIRRFNKIEIPPMKSYKGWEY